MSEAQRLREMGFRESLRVRGIPLVAPDRRTVTALVTPIGLQPDSERLEENLSASVMVTVPRDQFSTVPTAGAFFDEASGSSYRIGAVENLSGKPGVEFICEFVERPHPR
ncbi:MAG: hypothetical protein J0L84_03200 [Verrucomicrobia bacterium]|nr:hypothetical protein [Verrucomicrobiota bacterium]